MNTLKPLQVEKTTSGKWPNFIGKHKKLFVLLIILAMGSFFWLTWSSNSVFNFVFGGGSSLKTEESQVNVLLLGIAGKGHDGPNLTDTIMVASFNTKNHKLNLISLPRDLWVDEHKVKVNALYQLGINKGDGLGLATKEIGDISGIKIPYAVRVDFSGFTKAVDLVGGVDVDVAKSFDDYAYPVPGKENEYCGYQEKDMEVDGGIHQVLLDPEGKIATSSAQVGKKIEYNDNQVIQFFSCRFEHISFMKGITHMDGETALKFARSRHGSGNEGTDFARSRRQQLILQAFKDKVFSLQTLTDPAKIISLVKTFGDSIDTNITQSQYPAFIKLAKQIEGTKSYSIDSVGTDPLLISPPTGVYGAWVLIPPDNDFTRIHSFVDDILSGKLEASSSAQQK